jgi:hypothetical protein
MSVKKYLTLNGLTYFLSKIKSTMADELDGKSDVGHTHTKSDITDLPSGLTVDTTLDGTSSNAISNSAVSNALDGLSTVATSGSYNDLSNKPTIPTYSAGTNLSLNDTTFNVSSTPSFTNITIGGYTITID